MNAATYSVAGRSKTCSGVSYCSMRPWRMIASRSPRASASDWSWVTNTAVKPSATVELVDLGAHLVAETGVEVAERFVEQHQVGSGDEAAGERDALLLATAELRRIAVEERSAIDEGGGLLDPTALEALLDPPRLERVGDVLAHRHVRPQRVRLEHHADVALVRRQVDPAVGVEHRGRRRS